MVHLRIFTFSVEQGGFLIGSFKYSFLPCSSELSEILLGSYETINADVHYYPYRFPC